jgi:superfamily I DNA and RNA helicase
MNVPVQIALPEPLAQVFEAASETDRQKAQWLIELVLNDLFDPSGEKLSDVVVAISQQAASRGMTAELLEDLLRDET